MPMILPTFIVGIVVVSFRIFVDLISNNNFEFIISFSTHLSTFFYYFTYSLLFYLIKVKRFQSHLPIIIGLSTLIEICSSTVELVFRHFILSDTINGIILGKIILIALIRSIFVLGIFSMIKLQKTEQEIDHQQTQNAHMIFLISNLYEESIELKKSLQNAENITRNCYNLYRKIQSKDLNINIDELSKKLLVIAGEVHDIKKDNQRIYSGISKMISGENSTDYMDIKEIGNIIINSNKKYADSLGKNIKFFLIIKSPVKHIHIYTTLSLINNLVSNSIESISKNGMIKIIIYRVDNYIRFEVHDNGIGIPDKKRNLIFKAGYTTKYDMYGTPSTGMGLPYIKKLVEELNGTIELKSEVNANNTVFIITLPIKSLSEKG
jgi:two-component system sensor histidine kinase YcbA